MAFDIARFTDRCLSDYTEQLKERLPLVKFVLEESLTVNAATQKTMLSFKRSYTMSSISFPLAYHLHDDGTLDEDTLAEAVSSGLSEPLIVVVENALKDEEDNPIKKIGAGQLWVIHRALSGGEVVTRTAHISKNDHASLLGQLMPSEDIGADYIAKTMWALARYGETKKVPVSPGLF